MKNNKRKSIICVALLLLVVVIAMSSYTFAKYVTSDSATTSATVAKWGFVVDVDATDLFATDYTLGTGATLATKATGTGVAVDAQSAAVAPGTTGSMTFSISGTAEVLAKITVTASGTDVSLTDTKGTDDTTDDQVYNPIKWTLKKDNTVVSGCEDVTLATIITKLNSYTTEVTAGTTSSVNGSYTITWEWAFSNTSSGITNLSVDDADTILGYAANDSDIDSKYTAVTGVSNFSVSISVEQLQTSAN